MIAVDEAVDDTNSLPDDEAIQLPDKVIEPLMNTLVLMKQLIMLLIFLMIKLFIYSAILCFTFSC